MMEHAVIEFKGTNISRNKPITHETNHTMLHKHETSSELEPRIVGFICNWGAYSGLEMAGVNGLKYTPNVQFIRLMCMGRVHAGLILKAFELGADGVLLLACASGDCHYEFGVDRARESLVQVEEMLNMLGLDSRRLKLAEVPSGDGEFVADEINSFENSIMELGPSPIKPIGRGISMQEAAAMT